MKRPNSALDSQKPVPLFLFVLESNCQGSDLPSTIEQKNLHFFLPVPYISMATATISQALPRFLLPRLSWQQVPLQHNAVRGLSTIPARYDGHPRQKALQAKKVPTKYDASHRTRTSILENPVHRRAFHATARRARDHHFDTLKFVQRLQEEGFTEAQSVAMMKVLSDVIEERSVDL